jgi:hypothetical protein
MVQHAAHLPVQASRSFRRKHAVLIAIIFIPLLVGGLFLYHNYCGGLRLQQALEEADRLDPHWRIPDIEAHRRDVPDAENGLVQALAALSLLPQPWPNWDNQTDGEKSEARAKRLALAASFQELQPPVQLNDLQIEALRAELRRADKAVIEARKLIDLPYGIRHLNWTRNYYDTLLPHVQSVRELANVLSYDILAQIEDGNLSQALLSAQAELNTGRALGDEPTLISQLVRIAIDTLTVARIERILGQGEPPPADLLAVQHAVEQEAEEPLLYYGLRGERAMVDGFLENVQKGEVSFREMGNMVTAWRLVGALAGGRSQGLEVQTRLEAFTVVLAIRSQRAETLRYMNRLLEAARLPADQQAASLQKIESMDPRDQPLMIRLLGTAGFFKVAHAANRIRAQLRSTAVALAAERYRQTHGRWPRTLDELVPEYLAAIPLDPFNGRPLRLGRYDQGIVIYSVGLDGMDNGGAIHIANPMASGSDVGFRLWDVKRRRQKAKENAN